jgi:hypothetical protein
MLQRHRIANQYALQLRCVLTMRSGIRFERKRNGSKMAPCSCDMLMERGFFGFLAFAEPSPATDSEHRSEVKLKHGEKHDRRRVVRVDLNQVDAPALIHGRFALGPRTPSRPARIFGEGNGGTKTGASATQPPLQICLWIRFESQRCGEVLRCWHPAGIWSACTCNTSRKGRDAVVLVAYNTATPYVEDTDARGDDRFTLGSSLKSSFCIFGASADWQFARKTTSYSCPSVCVLMFPSASGIGQFMIE